MLLGAIVVCCAWWAYRSAEDGGDDGIFGILPELGAGAIVLLTVVLCCAAAQRGGSTEWLFIPLVGLICSAVLTLTYRVAVGWA